MTVESWEQIPFSGDPILAVELRGDEGFEQYRLTLDRDLNAELEAITEVTLEYLDESDRVAYSPYADIEDHEYFSLEPEILVIDIEEGSDDGDAPGIVVTETAGLLYMVENAASLPALGARQLLERIDDLYSQAICRRSPPDYVGFVTGSSPRRRLGRSMLPFGLDDEGDRFKKIQAPDLLLERQIHAVMAPEEIAILNRVQFEFLVSDIGLVVQAVPAQVRRLATRLSAVGLPLSAGARQAIESKAQSSVQLAKRLDALCDRVTVIDVDVVLDGSAFEVQEVETSKFLNEDGELECKEGDVRELMDALEGRFFSDPLTPEKRRADRYRRR